MAGARITITGDRKLDRKLRRLQAEAGPLVNEALDDWAGDVVDGAQQRVPVLTGTLRSAIEQRVHREAHYAEVGVWTVIYALWTELGNSRQEGQPYLYPAFAANRDMRGRVRRALDKRV